MFVSNRNEKHDLVLVEIVLLKGEPIRPIFPILRDGQDFQVEDQDLRGMAERIAQTEQELSNGSNR